MANQGTLSLAPRRGLSSQTVLIPLVRIIFYRWNFCIKSGLIAGGFSLCPAGFCLTSLLPSTFLVMFG